MKPNGVFAMIGGSMGWLLFQMMLVQPLLSKFRKKKLGIMGYRVSTEALQETANAFRHFEKGNFKGKIVISNLQGI